MACRRHVATGFSGGAGGRAAVCGTVTGAVGAFGVGRTDEASGGIGFVATRGSVSSRSDGPNTRTATNASTATLSAPAVAHTNPGRADVLGLVLRAGLRGLGLLLRACLAMAL